MTAATGRDRSGTANPPTDFRVWLDVDAEPPLVGAAGEIDLFTCAAFRHALDDARTANPHHIALDFRHVTFMGSIGVREISRIARGTETIEIRSPNDAVRRMLEVSGLNDEVTIVE